MYYLDLEIVPVEKCDTLVGLVAFEWSRCDETREGVVCCLKPLHLLQWGQPICVVRGKIEILGAWEERKGSREGEGERKREEGKGRKGREWREKGKGRGKGKGKGK